MHDQNDLQLRHVISHMPLQPLQCLQEVETYGSGQQAGENTVVISNDGNRSVKVLVKYSVMPGQGALPSIAVSVSFKIHVKFDEVREQEATLGYRQYCEFTLPTASTSASVSCVQLSGNDAPNMLFQNIAVKPGKTYRLE